MATRKASVQSEAPWGSGIDQAKQPVYQPNPKSYPAPADGPTDIGDEPWVPMGLNDEGIPSSFRKLAEIVRQEAMVVLWTWVLQQASATLAKASQAREAQHTNAPSSPTTPSATAWADCHYARGWQVATSAIGANAMQLWVA